MTILNPGKPRRLTAEFYTADNKPARVDGSPVWAVSNPDVAELETTLSDFSVRVIAKAPGTCEVTATADADLGEGFRAMVLTAAFTVPEPEATTGSLVIGEEEVPPAPEPIPEPVPEPTPEPVVEAVAPEPVVEPAPAPEPVVEAAVPVEEVVAPVVEEATPPPPEPPAADPERPTE